MCWYESAGVQYSTAAHASVISGQVPTYPIANDAYATLVLWSKLTGWEKEYNQNTFFLRNQYFHPGFFPWIRTGRTVVFKSTQQENSDCNNRQLLCSRGQAHVKGKRCERKMPLYAYGADMETLLRRSAGWVRDPLHISTHAAQGNTP